MKKFLLVLLTALLIIPMTVFADGEEEVTTTIAPESNEVTVYFFRGEGCSHCAEAEAWFSSIEEEYGNYFKIVDYETWNDANNAKLMEKVAKARGEEAKGVPYIIIGNKSWSGFTTDYSTEMLEQIKKEYEVNPAERYDIMSLITEEEEKEENDFGKLVVVIAIVGIVCFGIYKARNASE